LIANQLEILVQNCQSFFKSLFSSLVQDMFTCVQWQVTVIPYGNRYPPFWNGVPQKAINIM